MKTKKEQLFNEFLEKAHKIYHLKEKIEYLEKGLNRQADFRLYDFCESVPNLVISSDEVKCMCGAMKERLELDTRALLANFRKLEESYLGDKE